MVSIKETFFLMSSELLQQSTLIVGLGLGVSFSILYFACETASACSDNGSCVRTTFESSRYLPQCNFKRVPGLVPATEYILDVEGNVSSQDLNTALRAYCSPGERLQMYLDDDGEYCTPQYTYPNSLSTEIMDASGATPSERVCGEWMKAGSVSNPMEASYWSFSGIAQETEAVNEAALSAVTSSLSRTNVGKLNEKCTHTVLAGDTAILASAREAYQHLVSASGLDAAADSDSVLQSLGTIVGHYCDGPVTIGWNYASVDSPGAFAATMYVGARFSDTAIGEAMQMVGEDTAITEAAVEGNRRVNREADLINEYPSLHTLTKVYEGASGRADHEDVSLQYAYANELVGFKRLLQENLTLGKAYVRGVASTCSFAVSSSLNYVGYTVLPSWSVAQQDLNARRAAKHPITALGRLQTKLGGIEPMREIDNVTMHNATSATFSQLVSSSLESPEAQCADYASKLFPDTLDAERFSNVYTGDLYTKLQLISRRAQQGVEAVLRENQAIRKVLADPDQVADDVAKVRLRIPGAPRRTWAGADRSLPYAFFESDDSFFKMVLKQARVVFLDRQSSLVFDSTDVCDGPPVMDSLTANAYIYPSVHCSYYLLGLSLRPFLDPSFDEESILSRWAYVVAHEYAHSTLNTPWVTSELESLLHRYDPSTYSEAIADVVAGLGLIRSNQDWAYQLNPEKLCDHVAQTWCARTGLLYYQSSGGIHPKANERGDFFCDTILQDFGYQ